MPGRGKEEGPRSATPGGGVRLTSVKRLGQEQEGHDLAEYGVLLILVACGAIASIQTFARAVSTLFSSGSAGVGGS